MSVIKEHDRVNYTKEKDQVERYLIRIIERYFEIQNDYSRATIESIVQESFTRLKRYMYHNKGFVFSLNHYTGHLSLDISFFNGEPLISNKETAFNKDFGDEADTVCEGNDERLYDARIPLTHYHDISEVPGLKEFLDELDFNDKIHHDHKNISVLDMLKYTGTRTKIDLILLEDLEANVQEYINQVRYHQKEALVTKNEHMDMLVIQLELLNRYFNDLKQEVIKEAINWIGTAYDYILENGEINLKDNIAKILPYVADEYSEKVKENFSRMDKLLYDGTFNLSLTTSDKTYDTTSNTQVCIYNTPELIKQFYYDSYKQNFVSGQYDFNIYQWSCDQTTGIISCEENVDVYTTLLTQDEYKDYSIRVTLKGESSDDDAVCIVLGESTIDDCTLTLMFSPGGINHNGLVSGQTVPHLSLITNFQKTDMALVKKINVDCPNSWSNIPDGITILANRKNNKIKIWYEFGEAPAKWKTYKFSKIEETNDPDLELDLETELNILYNKDVKIGFGTFSQIADFSDIYMSLDKANVDYNTSINSVMSTVESSNPGITLYQENTSSSKRIRMYFQYENDLNQVIRSPLPFKCVTDDKKQFIITGRYNILNGTMEANINCSQNLPINLDCPKRVFLQDTKDVYVPVLKLANNNFYSTIELLESCGAEIPYLSETIHNQLETILNQIYTETGADTYKNRAYLINGNYDSTNQNCYKTFNEQISLADYYNLRIDQSEKTLVNNGFIVMKVKDGEAQNLDLVEQNDYFEDIGFILHYKELDLSAYFKNPKIYFQVFGGAQ